MGNQVATCGWNESFVEETNKTVLTPETYIYIIAYPILLLFCTVGNITSLIVLINKKNKTTTSIFLIVVCAADLCVLWFYLSTYIPEMELIYLNTKAEPSPEYFYVGGVSRWLHATCIQISDWTLIAFSFERLLVTSYPLRFKDYPRTGQRRAIFMTIAIIFLAMVFQIETLIEHYYSFYHDLRTFQWPEWLVNWNLLQHEAEVAMTIAKWLLLTISNFIVATNLLKSLKAGRLILTHSIHPSASTRQRNSNGNRLLLASALLYFFTQAPNVILSCLRIASRPPHCTYNLAAETDVTALPIINTILLSNYSLNFIVYCFATTHFRVSLKGHLMGVRSAMSASRTVPADDIRIAKFTSLV